MKILAADDEALALQLLTEAIQAAQPEADVYPFRKAPELLAFAEDTVCDIAFLDINLREMDGIALAQALKARSPRINIIFVTGYAEYMGQAFALHASGYVLKPPTAEAIAQEIANLRYPPAPAQRRIRVQTFGNFELFADGKIVPFTRLKSKELLAYLIDRKGASVTSAQIASILWEDKVCDRP